MAHNWLYDWLYDSSTTIRLMELAEFERWSVAVLPQSSQTVELYSRTDPQRRGGGGDAVDGPPSPLKRARKYYLNVSENKSNDIKLPLIPFVSSAFYVE